MGKSRELLSLVGQGAVDVAATPASYFPTQLPFLSAPSSLPLTLDSVRQGHVVMHTLWQEMPAMQEEARKANVFPLFFHVLNPYHLLCTKPVRSLDDLKGKKLRSWGEDMPRAWQAIGAVPVTVLPGDFYESLQRGSIDCMLLPWDLIVAFKLHEVAKYGSAVNLGAVVSNPQWYNLPKWHSFPPQVKTLFLEVADEARKRDATKAEEAERSAFETMKAAGVEIIPFADQAKFEKAMPDFLGDWIKKMEKLGAGSEATAMVKRWKELRAQTK
jgi:TRAP-type C4-dicarboxylate transport system substrate-binding protein